MATIDLKDAYYSVKIDELDTKYLKFWLNYRLLKFVVLQNDLSPGPRKFTKLTKQPLALLRIQEHTVGIYIDDILSVDDTFESCLLTVIKTIKLFQGLGFVIHPEKGKFKPSKKLNILALLLIQREWLHISVIIKTKRYMINVSQFQKSKICKLGMSQVL